MPNFQTHCGGAGEDKEKWVNTIEGKKEEKRPKTENAK